MGLIEMQKAFNGLCLKKKIYYIFLIQQTNKKK